MIETETDSNNFIQRKVNTIITILNTSPTENDFTVTDCDIFWTAISILCRIINIILTINLAYDYYRNGKIDYFIWTLICFIIPMFVTTLIQITIYREDNNSVKLNKKGKCGVLCFVIVIPFLFRYCQSLSYAIAARRAERRNDKIEQKRYYELLIHEDSDVALIRIFECFLEAAPQKVLQISIILSGTENINVHQILSIIGSIQSMAWCIASYHRCIRFAQADKFKISWFGTVIQWLWNFLISVSRVTSIAIIASVFPLYTLAGCILHAFFMSLWIFFKDRSPFCSSTCFHSVLFSMILGIVFIFNYIVPKPGKTRYRYTVFYLICLLEIIACVTFYYFYVNDAVKKTMYFIPLCLLSLLPFGFGIIFMIIYYVKFHPNIAARKQPITSSDTQISEENLSTIVARKEMTNAQNG